MRFSGQSDPSSADTTAGFHYAYACDNGSLATATYLGSGTAATQDCTFNTATTHINEVAETENRGSRQGSRQHDCRENYSTPSLHLVTHPRLRIEAVRLLRAQLRLKSNGITMGRQSQPIA